MTILFYCVLVVALVLAVHKVRAMVCRPRNLYFRRGYRMSLPEVLRLADNERMQDPAIERDVKSWLYPEEK